MEDLFDRFAAGCGHDGFWDTLDRLCEDDEVLDDLVERQRTFVEFCIANEISRDAPEAIQLETTVGRDWTARVFRELVRRTALLKQHGIRIDPDDPDTPDSKS